MVKFSSVLDYRNYIDNLPLDFIVMELIRVKTASKTSLLRPAPLLGPDAINYSLEDLVGKITFKLFNYYSGTPNIMYDNIFQASPDVYKNLLLYCTYYHDVDDVWIVPLQVDVFYRVRINAKTALKPLYYTPERPLIKISYPDGFYENDVLSKAGFNTHNRRFKIKGGWRERGRVLATRLLLDYRPSRFGGTISRILNYGILRRDGRTKTGTRYDWDTDLDLSYRYGKVRQWFDLRPDGGQDSEFRWKREAFEKFWLQGLFAGYQPFIYDQGYDLDILPDFTLMVDLPLDSNEYASQYYLLFDPMQTGALNYPQGDFVVI